MQIKEMIHLFPPDIIHTLVLTCFLLTSGYYKRYQSLKSMILHDQTMQLYLLLLKNRVSSPQSLSGTVIPD